MKNIHSSKQENSISLFKDSNMSKSNFGGILKNITSNINYISLRLILLLIFSVAYTFSAFSQAVVTYEANVPANQSGSSGTITVTYVRNDATFYANGTGKVVTDFPATFTIDYPWASYKTNVWASGPGADPITSGTGMAYTEVVNYPTNTTGGSLSATLKAPYMDYLLLKTNLAASSFNFNKGYAYSDCAGGTLSNTWMYNNSNPALLTTTAPFTVTGANPAPQFYTSNVIELNRTLPAASTFGANINYIPPYTRFTVGSLHSSADNDCPSPGNKTIAGYIGTDGTSSKNVNYTGLTPNRSLMQMAFTRSTNINNINSVNTGSYVQFEPISLSLDTSPACSDPAKMAANCDYDGDGVLNSVDLDVDNDGILDAVEAPSCYYTESEADSLLTISTALFYTAPDSIRSLIDGNITTTQSFNFNTGQALAGTSIFQFTTLGNAPLDTVIVDMAVNATGTNGFGASGATGKLQGWNGTAWLDLSGNINLNSTVLGNIYFPVTTNNVTWNYTSFRIIGVATANTNVNPIAEVRLSFTTNYVASASPKPTCSTDTDGDGILNIFDLDSDGDGCPDALEGGAGLSNTALVTSSLSGGNTGTGYIGVNYGVTTNLGNTVGTTATTKGVPTIAGTGQSVGSSQNSTVKTTYCTTHCGGTVGSMGVYDDFDGDGVCNGDDLDDDNDGVPDTLEGCVKGQVTFGNVQNPNGDWTKLVADIKVGTTVVGTVEWTEPNASITGNTGRGITFDGANLYYSTGTSSVPGATLKIIPAAGYTFNSSLHFVENANAAMISGQNGYFDGGNDNNGSFTHTFSSNLDGSPIVGTYFELGGSASYVLNYNIGDPFSNTTPVVNQDSTNTNCCGGRNSWGVEIPFTADNSHPFTFNYWARYGGVAWETSTINFNSLQVSCTSNDTDGDGIPNEFDLDSDGDGCPDAVEASVSGTLLSGTVINPSGTSNMGNAIAQGTYGTNGLANSLETNDNSTATITYNNTYNLYAINSAINLCKDADGDGVADYFDLDDDNDGILDAVESPGCFYTQAEAQKIIGITSDMTIDTYNPSTSTTVVNTPGTNLPLLYDDNTTNFFNRIKATSLVLDGMAVYTVKYNLPISITSLTLVKGATLTYDLNSFVLQGSNDNNSWLTISTPTNDVNGNLTLTNTSTSKFQFYRVLDYAHVSGTTGDVSQTALYPSRYTSEIQVVYPSGYIASANPKPNCTDSDMDGDGIPNYLDLDSDGDGCSDAKEAGVTNFASTTSAPSGMGATTGLANAVAPAPYSGNGFSNILQAAADTNTYKGTYTYQYAISKFYSICADSDGDGIPDVIDLDDDNDGILDAIECPSCYYTAAEIAKPIAITSALTYSSGTNANLIDSLTTPTTAFTASQSTAGKAIFTITPVTPMKMDTLTFQMNANNSFLSATANSVQVQGWNGSAWINVTDTITPPTNPVPAAAGGFINIPITKNKADYSQYRLVGTAATGTVNANAIQEIKLKTTSKYVPSVYQKVTCSTDTDGDGITNDKDLDSDGDDCADAVEAGVTSLNNVAAGDYYVVNGVPNESKLLPKALIFGQYDENGFANSIQSTSDTNTYRGSYTYSQAIDGVQCAECLAAVLPIELVSFVATKNKNLTVNINWKTASEINNDKFIVERSTDAIHWIEIFELKGKGFSNEIQDYNCIDSTPQIPNNYYRLKQVDFDGAFSYSNIEFVQFEENVNSYNIYPNPFSNELIIQSNNSNSNHEISVIIYSMIGETLYTNISNQNSEKLDLSFLKPGSYILFINQNKFKIIKQ